jgi:hypothetical protein
MKRAVTLLLLCVSGMAFGQDPKPATTANGIFDGTWATTLVVPDHTGLNGATALGFTFYFTAQVKNGILNGEYGSKAKPPWLSIDGKIDPDGSALLIANGITRKPA